MPHPYNQCADCEYVCEESDPCIRDIEPDEDRAYEAERDRRIGEEADR